MQGENCKQWLCSTAAASTRAPEDQTAVHRVGRRTFGAVQVLVFGRDCE